MMYKHYHLKYHHNIPNTLRILIHFRGEKVEAQCLGYQAMPIYFQTPHCLYLSVM